VKPWLKAASFLAFAAVTPSAVDAFCGFYVAQADATLFNQSSRVVLARDGNHTVLTMSNDYKGDPREFAIVIPVPTVIEREQIDIADGNNITYLDTYTAPRLVEYWDPDPCPEPYEYGGGDYPMEMAPMAAMDDMEVKAPASSRSLGVTIERSFDVGEYDILILSAKDSTGLETWLHQEGYHLPTGASSVLQSYIRQNMHFFVAKVDLGEQDRLGNTFLRPLKVSYDSPKFMLPIRLGMVNADGPQDLFIFALTPQGRVETTNYRTTKIPTDLEVPEYVQQEFGPFYKDMFSRQVAKQGMSTVFYEYGWPLTEPCDPCTADMPGSPLLSAFGATWSASVQNDYHGGTVTSGYITRLHVRYDMAHFPEDLVFQETADNATFQGRYIINHPFQGDTSCDEGRKYERTLATRQSQEVDNLSTMTGWLPAEIRSKMPKRAGAEPPPPPRPKSWWEQQ
jgi:hypothetical protein